MTEVGDAAEGGGVEPQTSSSQNDNASDPTLTNTSVNDPTLSKKPRDARLIHMVLAHYGVTGYQERVPLQLMDFAYRYTSSTLQDALHLTNEGYGTSGTGIGTGSKSGTEGTTVNLNALRLAIHSRTHYQYNPTLPKEYYMNLAQEKNRTALPPVQREWGMKLPPDQYLLTGQGWQMAEEFEGEGEEEEEGLENGDTTMHDHEGSDHAEGEVEGGTMEDIFGPDGGEGPDDQMQED